MFLAFLKCYVFLCVMEMINSASLTILWLVITILPCDCNSFWKSKSNDVSTVFRNWRNCKNSLLQSKVPSLERNQALSVLFLQGSLLAALMSIILVELRTAATFLPLYHGRVGQLLEGCRKLSRLLWHQQTMLPLPRTAQTTLPSEV